MFPQKGFSSLYQRFNTVLKILYIKSPSRTSFGLYFAYEEYCSDDQTVQRIGTIPLTYSRRTELSSEESGGTVLSADF